MSQPPWTSHPSGGGPLPPSGPAAPVRSPGVLVAAIILIAASLLTLSLGVFTFLPLWLMGIAVVPLGLGAGSLVTSAGNPTASRRLAKWGCGLLLVLYLVLIVFAALIFLAMAGYY